MKKVKVFSDWVESQLYALATLASLKVVNSGDVLIREGDDIDTMYFIAAGKCKVTKQVPAELCANQADILTQGKEQVVMLDGVKKTDAANDIIGLGELVKNDYFNECSVVPQQQLIQLGLSLQSADKSPVTVTAVDDGTRLISFSSYDARYKFGSMLQLTEASMTAMDTAQFTSRFQEHLIEQRWRQFKQIEMSRIYAEVLKI